MVNTQWLRKMFKHFRTQTCYPAEELELKELKKHTVQNCWIIFILAHILFQHLLLFFLLANDTFAWKAQRSRFTSFVTVEFLGQSWKHIFLPLRTDFMSVCFSVPKRELNSNFRGGLEHITDNWIMPPIPSGIPPNHLNIRQQYLFQIY